MDSYYTLSYSAGFLRSNKFEDKEDAVLLGAERAKLTGSPVTVFAHVGADQSPSLVCNPDGSVSKVDASFSQVTSSVNSSSVLIASFEDKHITTFFLNSEFPETKLKELEAKVKAAVGIYDPTCLIVYDQSPKVVSAVEDYLSKAGIVLEKVSYSHYKKKMESPLLVEAALSMQSDGLPKVKPVSFSYGSGSKIKQWECNTDVYRDSKTGKLKYLVKVNGKAVGTTSSYRTCLRLIREEAQSALRKYLDKVL